MLPVAAPQIFSNLKIYFKMAKQRNLKTIIGTYGAPTYYSRLDKKYSFSREQIEKPVISNDRRYERRRLRCHELSNAADAAVSFYDTVTNVLPDISDQTTVPRLQRRMLEIIQTDRINGFGYRTVYDADIKLLKGFEFESDYSFPFNDKLHYVISRDVPYLSPSVIISPFDPADCLIDTYGMSHFGLSIIMVQFREGEGFSYVDQSKVLEQPISISNQQYTEINPRSRSRRGNYWIILLDVTLFEIAMSSEKSLKVHTGGIHSLTVLDVIRVNDPYAASI
jgi:hypothetical protein